MADNTFFSNSSFGTLSNSAPPIGTYNVGLRIKLREIPGVTDPDVLSEPYYFQCPPQDEFQIQNAYSHQDYDTAANGQFSRRGGRQLRQVTFTTLVAEAGEAGPWTVLQDHDAIDAIAHSNDLVDIMEAGTPFRMIATHKFGHQFDLAMDATLRNVNIAERSGEVNTRYVDVTFVEYRDPVVTVTPLGKSTRKGGVKLPFTVRMFANGTFSWPSAGGTKPVAPLTLYKIAKAAYGTPDLTTSKDRQNGVEDGARLIALANGIRDWGLYSDLGNLARFLGGGTITVPRQDISLQDIFHNFAGDDEVEV